MISSNSHPGGIGRRMGLKIPRDNSHSGSSPEGGTMKIMSIAIAALILFVLVLFFLPIILFWSIETLFNYHIELTWKTWVAAIFLLGILSPTSKGK